VALIEPNPDNLTVYSRPVATGYILKAPLGTVIDPNPNTPFPSGVVVIGALDADAGIVEADNQEDGEDKLGLGNQVLYTTEGLRKPTLALTILETRRVDALNLAFGPGEVSFDEITEELTIIDGGKSPDPCMLIFQADTKGGKVARKIWKRVELASRGDRTISDTDVYGYPLVFNIRLAPEFSTYVEAPKTVPAG
jgi:hypothetical protein